MQIPDALKQQLDELSRQQQRPTSELVLEALHQYVVAEQLKAVRRMSVPLAEAQGYFTDEDIFRVVS